jgi:outer membrane protein assembly factor BamD
MKANKTPTLDSASPFQSTMRFTFAYLLIALMIAIIPLWSGCSSHRLKSDLDAEDRYLLAKKLLDKGDCQDAIQEFQKVIFNFPGSDYVDDAEYGLGEAHYCVKEFALAGSQFRRIIRDYPLSLYADDAQFMLGMCYYEQSFPSNLDQEFTNKAIEAFQKLTEDFPQSDRLEEALEKLKVCRNKLAKKDFDTGRLYLRLEYYGSALAYFEFILDQYPDSKWAAEAQYGIGQVYEGQDNAAEALVAYQKVVTAYPTEKAAEKAMKKIEEIKEKDVQ